MDRKEMYGTRNEKTSVCTLHMLENKMVTKIFGVSGPWKDTAQRETSWSLQIT